MGRGGEAVRATQRYVVVNPGRPDERWVAVRSRLFVGRECEGIDDEHRLLIDDPEVSRSHLELRVDPGSGRTSVVDLSTNGTYLDGVRLARAHAVPVKSGNQLHVGSAVLEFRTDRTRTTQTVDTRSTLRRTGARQLIMAVGDIAEYTTIAEDTPPEVLARGLDVIFEALQDILWQEHGSLAHYAGDAFFGVWEPERIKEAAVRAVSFVVRAVHTLAQLGPRLPIHVGDAGLVRMGWGIVDGPASVQSLPGGIIGVVGDATNLAFRLAGLAGRAGNGDVLVSQSISEQTGPTFRFGPLRSVMVKGRHEAEFVRELLDLERQHGL
jgi:adenylate cyclase